MAAVTTSGKSLLVVADSEPLAKLPPTRRGAGIYPIVRSQCG
jgi:hypothetical protein